MPSAAAMACEVDLGDAMDHISDLSDDLLLHVLRFLPDARDVVCASLLSTRWRRLLTRAPVLCIGNWSCYGRRCMDDWQFNDFLHNLLVRRTYYCGADADIETLVLRAWLWPGKSRADVWLRRAMRLAVTSLELEFEVWVPRRNRRYGMPRHVREKLRPRHSLPTTTRVTTLSLNFNYATLLLPPAVQFLALAELTLSTIWFSDDDGPRLGHLLSSPSCCPRLRKLKLSNLHGLHDLWLEGGALETLYLAQLNVRRLDVDAPRLSALNVDSYFMFYRYPEHSIIAVRAPALEKLDATLTLGYIQLELQRHTIHLLQQCRPIHGHLLRLHVPENLPEGEEDEEMMEIPQLPAVTNLILEFCSNNTHYLGAIVSHLLARCCNLEYLHLDYLMNPYRPRCEEGCDDCDLRGSWKEDMISLDHLCEVKLRGFSGQENCFLDMVQLLLACAPALERMVVATNASIEGWSRVRVVLVESLESSLPCGKGRWTAHHATDNAAVMSEYEWTPSLQEEIVKRCVDCQ